MKFYHEINLLYNRILDRDVDTEGYSTYKDFLENNGSLNELENMLKISDEYKKLIKKRKIVKKVEKPISRENKQVIDLTPIKVEESKPKYTDVEVNIEKEKPKYTDVEVEVNIEKKVEKCDVEIQTENTIYNVNEEPKKIKEFYKRDIKRVLSPLNSNEKKERVNVFGCFRNNEDVFDKIQDNFEVIEEKNKDVEFYYYFFENDSTDATPYLILDFMRQRKGRYTLTNVATKKWADVKALGRVQDMAMYRNAMKDLCTDYTNSKYTVIIDTGVDYDFTTYQRMVDVLDKNPDVAMVTPYGIVKGSKDKYYDTYAFEGFAKSTKIDIKYDLFNVKSAFGGFVVIRTEVFEKCYWEAIDEHRSEHNFFCNMVRNYGKVVIANRIKVEWTK